MTQPELIEHIRTLVESNGRPATARYLGITQSYLRDILIGARHPGKRVYEALGLRKTVTVTFERRDNGKD